MKEFIFTWNIENFSYSWHGLNEEICSPSFVADTLQNTVWSLKLYPRGFAPLGSDCSFRFRVREFLSLCLIRDEVGDNSDFLFNCEFSCISAKNSILKSARPEMPESEIVISSLFFLKRKEVLDRKKAMYLPEGTLTLQCRLWICEGDIDQFGQCFGRTRLEMDRVLSVQDMNLRNSKRKIIRIHSKRQTELMSVSLICNKDLDSLDFNIYFINHNFLKTFTVKFSVESKNIKLIDFVVYRFDGPFSLREKLPISSTEKISLFFINELKLTFELIYSTKKETSSIEKICPCSFKFPEFTSKCVLSFIPSGKLADCPSVSKDLWCLFLKHILCDVELKTQTTSLWAHKSVLCARSPVFSAMFTGQMKEKTSHSVTIEDIKKDTLAKFLSFLYTDNFEESKINAVVELYYAADKYLVEKLKFCCSYFFINNMDDVNVGELFMLADKHSDSYLKSKVEKYIAKHHERILKSWTWNEFSKRQSLWAGRMMLCKYQEERHDIRDKKCVPSSYPNALEDFRTLYQSQILSDIVIHTTDASFPAHMTMLCAGSSTLRKLLACEKPPVSLKIENLDADTVSRLLMFLYTDSLEDISWEDVTKLYHAAFAYQIERLKIKCSCFFLENLKTSNVANILKLAKEYGDVRLVSLAKDLRSRRYKKIIVSKNWTESSKTYSPNGIETRLSKKLRLENKSRESNIFM